MSTVLGIRRRPEEICRDCCGLIKSELERKAAQPTGQYIIVNDSMLEAKCQTCQLLGKGLRHIENQLSTLYLKWEIHQQNGLVLEAEENGQKVIAEFYYSERSPIMPDSISSKPHVIPWQEDEEWLKKCRTFVHDHIPDLPCPTRILALGDDLTIMEADIRLIEPATDDVEVTSYATLSHTWVQASSPPLKTTTLTLADHKHCIRFRDLSQTFRNAVITARKLGIHYLWIDSLSIIQGDKEDWAREGANMDQIYANSSVTIAMHDNEHTGGKIPYHSMRYNHGFQEAEVHVRLLPHPKDLLDHVAAAPRGPSQTEIAVQEEWNKVSLRGWCYQERALSKRVLHLTASEIVLEKDGRIIDCQCSHHHCQQNVGFAGWLTSDWDGGRGNPSIRLDRARYAWFDLVRQYTQRRFSHDTDLLPGMAGLALRMSRDCHMGPYAAGLWEQDLLQWLCWKSVPWTSSRRGSEFCPDCRPYPRRMAENSVPSFSWASRFGPVEFLEEPWRTSEFVSVGGETQVVCKTNSLSPYGAVSGGHVEFKQARLYPVMHFSTTGWAVETFAKRGMCQTHYPYIVDVSFVSRWDMGRSPNSVFDDVRRCGTRYMVDAADDLPPNESVVYLLELFYNTETEISVMLVLVRVGGKPPVTTVENKSEKTAKERPEEKEVGTFRRIGISFISKSSFVEPLCPTWPSTEIRLL